METQQTKTLEQVIMDASLEAVGPHGKVGKGEATAIAEAVRDWMRKQNEGLRNVIYSTLWSDQADRAYAQDVVDRILSVIPPCKVESAPDRERIKELEEQLRLRDAILISKDQDSISPNDLAVVQKQLERERERATYLENELKIANNARAILQSEMNEYPIQSKRITELEKENTQLKILAGAADNLANLETSQSKRIKELEAEVARLASLKSSPGCCDKAAKYDELRKKFPFLPGDEVFVLGGASIRKVIASSISERGVSFDNFGHCAWNECYPTAEACRAAIPIKE